MKHFLSTTVTTTLFLTLPSLGLGAPKTEPEIWRCFGNPFNTTPAIILSTQDENYPDRGAVFIANTAHFADYYMSGLDRIWRWEIDNGERNVFIIQPDQVGHHAMLSADSIETESPNVSEPLICFTGNERSPGEEMEALKNELNRSQHELKDFSIPQYDPLPLPELP